MNIRRIAGNMLRMVPVLTLGLSIGCLQGKSGWRKFIENTNTMITNAGAKYGCVGRGEGEIEMDSMLGDYIAEKIAQNNAYTDYKLRCVDPHASNVKIDKENGVIIGVLANGSMLKIRIFDCGKENYSSGEMYYSSVAVCGQHEAKIFQE